MAQKLERIQVLITKLDGGYVVELNYPFVGNQVIRLTIADVIDVLLDHFGEPFSAKRGEPTTAIEEWIHEKRGG